MELTLTRQLYLFWLDDSHEFFACNASFHWLHCMMRCTGVEFILKLSMLSARVKHDNRSDYWLALGGWSPSRNQSWAIITYIWFTRTLVIFHSCHIGICQLAADWFDQKIFARRYLKLVLCICSLGKFRLSFTSGLFNLMLYYLHVTHTLLGLSSGLDRCDCDTYVHAAAPWRILRHVLHGLFSVRRHDLGFQTLLCLYCSIN